MEHEDETISQTFLVLVDKPEARKTMPTYLYGLIEQRPGHPNFENPFYIGFGTVTRPYTHFKQVRSKKGHRNPNLHSFIELHFALGIEPAIRIFATYQTTAEAAVAEKALIAKFGRQGIDKNGILCNIASGGAGPDSELMRRPEIAARNAEAQRRRSPESKERSIEGLRQALTDPTVRDKKANNSREPARESWTNPVIREKRISRMQGVPKTMTSEGISARQANAAKPRSEQALAASRAATVRNWANPEFRDKRSLNQTTAWKDPTKRANMLAGRSVGIANSWLDPDVRERRIAGIRRKVQERALLKTEKDKSNAD